MIHSYGGDMAITGVFNTCLSSTLIMANYCSAEHSHTLEFSANYLLSARQ